MTRSPLAPPRFPDLPAVGGVRLATAAAGVRYRDRTDVLLAVMERAAVAGTFTRSSTRSAAVRDCERKLGDGEGPDAGPAAFLVNSGNSNAFTGRAGEAAVAALCDAVDAAVSVPEARVFTASTGVIGEPLPWERIAAALDALREGLGAPWEEAARAIMTTDTFPKGAGAVVDLPGGPVAIAGIAKGSGMIAPDMATMLAYVFTDAAVDRAALQRMVSAACERTFNRITVDGDTSTSDTLLVAATGAEAAERGVARGALSIANSPLVKTAAAGGDANWGRVVMAVGKSGAEADRDRLRIRFGEVVVAENGARAPGYSEEAASEHMGRSEILIGVDLGLGEGEAGVWTCDLTHGYVDINADYRS